MKEGKNQTQDNKKNDAAVLMKVYMNESMEQNRGPHKQTLISRVN